MYDRNKVKLVVRAIMCNGLKSVVLVFLFHSMILLINIRYLQ